MLKKGKKQSDNRLGVTIMPCYSAHTKKTTRAKPMPSHLSTEPNTTTKKNKQQPETSFEGRGVGKKFLESIQKKKTTTTNKALIELAYSSKRGVMSRQEGSLARGPDLVQGTWQKKSTSVRLNKNRIATA